MENPQSAIELTCIEDGLFKPPQHHSTQREAGRCYVNVGEGGMKRQHQAARLSHFFQRVDSPTVERVQALIKNLHVAYTHRMKAFHEGGEGLSEAKEHR